MPKRPGKQTPGSVAPGPAGPTAPAPVPRPRLTTAGLRTVALVEAAKGLFGIGLGIALLWLDPDAVREVLTGLGRRIGLNPAGLLDILLQQLAEQTSPTALRWLAAGAFAYAIIRLVEAWGLWRQRTWAEWLGAISGTIYIPFEIHELTHSVNALTVGLLLINVAVVLFLLWAARTSRRTRRSVPFSEAL